MMKKASIVHSSHNVFQVEAVFEKENVEVKEESAWSSKYQNIKILHECEVLIEKSVPRVTVWHHEALLSDAKL